MRGPYTWDQASYSYRSKSTGRFVSAQEVRHALDDALDASSKKMRALGAALAERRISLAEWQTGMAREIKSAHLYASAAAKGGWHQMTPADYGRAGQQIRTQYEYLRSRAAAIASGKTPLGQVGRISALYGQAARATYHTVEGREMGHKGFTEERNVRDARDSCPGCLAQTSREWVPRGELVPVGKRDCKGACRCRIAYRNPVTGDERAA
jgi:hypothetical protein